MASSFLSQSFRLVHFATGVGEGTYLFLFLLMTASGLAFVSVPADAAPEEIQVYLDDMTKPGYFGMDFHANYVLSGSDTPDYPGAQPPNHVYRLTPEFYYGVSKTLELGLYVLSSVNAEHTAYLDGEKLRAKYIAPHDETQGGFWGVNLEIGKTNLRVSEDPWNAELKGIYGLRSGRWTVAVNPNFDWSLSGPAHNPVSFDIDTRLAYKTDAGYQIGVESYNELGPLSDVGRLNKLSQMLYGVIDTQVGKADLNAGIGRGLTTASDRWVFKLILGIHN